MGAWIETWHSSAIYEQINVAPHVGAWIETYVCKYITKDLDVAPHVGAWIETYMIVRKKDVQTCRAPRGRVD